MVRIDDYQGQVTAWCPDCGDFRILQALKKALVNLKLEPHQVLIVSGIGQASKLPHYRNRTSKYARGPGGGLTIDGQNS